MQQQSHVSIIGAGLGGLCLAQGLRRAGISFDVYERDRAAASRSQGYRIRIDADGQEALSRCLPPELYELFRQSCGGRSAGVRFLGSDLEPVPGRPAASWRTSGPGDEPSRPHDLSANRQTLREILMCGLKDRVHFGKAFRRFDAIGDNDVRVVFEDGEETRSTLLVGADGANSAVRGQLAPEAEPVDTGAACIYGKTIATEALLERLGTGLWAGTSVIFADGFAVILDPMLFPQPLPAMAPACRLGPVDDYLYWAFIGPRARLGLGAEPLPEQTRLPALVETVVRQWHPLLRTLFAHGDLRTLAVLPVRSSPPEIATWSPGPVTLLGDAIHAMSPAGGVGANTALRDAAALANAIASEGCSRAAVSSYETAMRAWAKAAITASNDGARSLFDTGTSNAS
ncbi:FAD-dependent oxidoreductase [Variovorax sp. W6]|uniref:FAD-dependent oxidoreductase n=1 Tax=Variovorax sp. W6 TaxID=3093895 RepID=UPI003D802BF1